MSLPSQVPERTLTFLSGCDSLIPAPGLRKYFAKYGIECIYEPDHLHGGFLADPAVVERICARVRELVERPEGSGAGPEEKRAGLRPERAPLGHQDSAMSLYDNSLLDASKQA